MAFVMSALFPPPPTLQPDADAQASPKEGLHRASEAEENFWLDPFRTEVLRVSRGEVLFRPGDRASRFYVVVKGSFKSEIVDQGGRGKVLGFCFASDVMGISGLWQQAYTYSITALEVSKVLVIDARKLVADALVDPARQTALFALAAKAMSRLQQECLMLGAMCAEERVVWFLNDMFDRRAMRRSGSHELVLRMTRAEIGSYLGLTNATVSRVLANLKDGGFLQLEKKEIRLVDNQALMEILYPTRDSSGQISQTKARCTTEKKQAPFVF
jgi:CRP/FNR family transcriptional regulator